MRNVYTMKECRSRAETICFTMLSARRKQRPITLDICAPRGLVEKRCALSAYTYTFYGIYFKRELLAIFGALAMCISAMRCARRMCLVNELGEYALRWCDDA